MIVHALIQSWGRKRILIIESIFILIEIALVIWFSNNVVTLVGLSNSKIAWYFYNRLMFLSLIIIFYDFYSFQYLVDFLIIKSRSSQYTYIAHHAYVIYDSPAILIIYRKINIWDIKNSLSHTLWRYVKPLWPTTSTWQLLNILNLGDIDSLGVLSFWSFH